MWWGLAQGARTTVYLELELAVAVNVVSWSFCVLGWSWLDFEGCWSRGRKSLYRRGLRGQDLYAVESNLCGSCYDVLIPYATWICYSSPVGF